jgi:hypothetical protein
MDKYRINQTERFRKSHNRWVNWYTSSEGISNSSKQSEGRLIILIKEFFWRKSNMSMNK